MRKAVVYAAISLMVLAIALEASLIVSASNAESRAVILADALQRLQFDTTSLQAADALLKEANISSEPEACSSVLGQCHGISVRITSYPDFRFPLEKRLSRALMHTSPIEPSSIEVDIYFVGNTLHSSVSKYEQGKCSIAVAQYASDQASKARIDWNTASPRDESNKLRATLFELPGSSLDIIRRLDLRFIDSTQKCRNAASLWPSAPIAMNEAN